MNSDLISRAALKEQVKNEVCEVCFTSPDERQCSPNCKLCKFNELIDNAPPVEQSEIWEGGFADGLATGAKWSERPQGGWILVSERLPNRNGVYNVTRMIDGSAISDSCYFDGQNTWHRDTGVNHGRPYLTDIIAWQYLPEPYQKGGAE